MSRWRKRREPAVQGLALPGEAHRRNNSIDDPILVGIGKDNRGTLAHKFERHRHDAVRGSAHDQLADLRRASEGKLAYHRVVGERSATFLAEPVNTLSTPGGRNS